jgi:oligopeptidase A
MTNDSNPLLTRSGLPPFDRIKPVHVEPAVRRLLTESLAEVEQLEANVQPSWTSLVESIEDVDVAFEYTWGPIGHLFGVRNSEELREAYEAVLGDVVEFGLRVSQSKPLFDALKQLRESDEWNKLDAAQQRIIDKRIQSAELAGIGLQGENRDRFNEIASEMSQLTTDFSNHVLDATNEYSLIIENAADADGFPASLRQMVAASWNSSKGEDAPEATAEDGPWKITLAVPCFSPFMQHCRNRSLREQVYRAYISRASAGDLDNGPLINRILKLRREQSRLLGFNNYAELSLSQKMAPTIDAVQSMYDTLREKSWDSAVQDLEEIQQLARASGQTEDIAHWDISFWSERLREQRFDYTDEQLRPYFGLERVLDGLFSLCSRLFGITVESADGDAPIWQEDVRFFRVLNATGSHIASFYLDPYSRPEDKRGGAWMNDCLGRRHRNGSLQVPVAHLVCNGTPPVDGKPSLMTFREVETLFHEFGHGLQHMLTTVDYSDAAGISGVEWDAVELPSQFMENWCYHKPTLIGMTAHYETGESLPDELFDKIVAARTFRAGSDMMRQLLFGMIDIELHSTFDPDGDETVFDVQRRISEKTSPMPPLPDNRFLCSFEHIFAGGYAAGYYSYKWAEVLSADAFGAFEEAGLDNETAIAETGRRFRDTVLSLGGSRHPMDIFREFRGREPDTAALLRHNGLAG